VCEGLRRSNTTEKDALIATSPRYLFLALVLLLPGCASTPEPAALGFAPSDPTTVQQSKMDRAACIGEATQVESRSVLKRSFEDAYDQCMATRGHIR
jgi:hypothetical protein